MNNLLTFLLPIVAISYVLFWRKIMVLTNYRNEMERQVFEKKELLTYATANERKATEQMELINNSKKQLLNIVNYEIRTPLNGILGMVSLLEDSALTTEQREYSSTIRNCSENLITMVNDIVLADGLIQAKIDLGKEREEQKNFDLRNSIEEVFDVFAAQTARVDLELVYIVDPQIPSVMLGDSLRLRQVLMNLVENAITFSREGEVFVKVSVVDESDKALELGFEVHDNGLGIPKDIIKLLSIDDISLAGAPGATERGALLICKRLIALMGGRLSIVNGKGNGTIAKFNLKFQRSERDYWEEQDMTLIRGRKILVVEDNLKLRHALESEIKEWKLVPIMASTGTEALEILAHNTDIDLALVEMQMPVMDGMVVSQYIRQNCHTIPIILLTVANDLDNKFQSGIFHAVIAKPIRYNTLIKHITNALLNKQPTRTSVMQSPIHKFTKDFAERFPLKILIAEDNRINQKLAMKVLVKLGYNPDIAENGKEVLEEVSKVSYDLIFMDVQMPEMDGLEATRMVRLCLSVQPIIIAMTANAMQGDREDCMRAGMDDYISKPVRLEELVVMLEKWALKIKK